MSHSDNNPFSYSYHSNHVADDSSTVFDADTVTPDEVPSLPAMPPLPTLTATATTTDYHQQQPNKNNETISSSPHSSQEESPANTISELLRRINYQRSLAMPSTSTITITTAKATSSKKRPITNSSSHQTIKRPRRSSRLKRQSQKPDQSCVDKSDSEVDDENGLDVAVINQSSSSQTSTTKELTKYEARWRSKFQELCAFKQLHGHINVPKTNKELNNWVKTQRTQYRKLKENKDSNMTKERIQTLESIGFEWVSPNYGGSSKDESKWNERFNELKAYKEKYGRTNVPQRKMELGAWISTQRTEYRKLKDNKYSRMTPERIQMLESIGFEWVSPNKGGPRNESAWNKRFTELLAYKELHGHTNVPKKWKDNKQLGQWVRTQRTQYRKFQENNKSQITSERIKMLNAIGFQWECRPGRAL